LIPYWITPSEDTLPYAIGVTAFSLDDANKLIHDEGWDIEIQNAQVIEGIDPADLDQGKIVPNMGPIVCRGVWYPCLNIGFGASGDRPITDHGKKDKAEQAAGGSRDNGND